MLKNFCTLILHIEMGAFAVPKRVFLVIMMLMLLFLLLCTLNTYTFIHINSLLHWGYCGKYTRRFSFNQTPFHVWEFLAFIFHGFDCNLYTSGTASWLNSWIGFDGVCIRLKRATKWQSERTGARNRILFADECIVRIQMRNIRTIELNSVPNICSSKINSCAFLGVCECLSVCD